MHGSIPAFLHSPLQRGAYISAGLSLLLLVGFHRVVELGIFLQVECCC